MHGCETSRIGNNSAVRKFAHAAFDVDSEDGGEPEVPGLMMGLVKHGTGLLGHGDKGDKVVGRT